MKLSPDQKRIRFYLLTGMVFLILWILSELANNPDTFGERVMNNIWRAGYVTGVNYFFFEYTVTALSWKKIFRSIALIIAFIFLYSWGLLLWRYIGIGLHFYTALTTFSSLRRGASQQMSYSVGSVFFFGIIRHIYDYIKLKQATQQLRIEKQEA